jgi:hypothetical protein
MQWGRGKLLGLFVGAKEGNDDLLFGGGLIAVLSGWLFRNESVDHRVKP